MADTKSSEEPRSEWGAQQDLNLKIIVADDDPKDLNLKILVVDDDPNIVDVLQSFLESEGYEVVTADSGISAINALKEPYPQIILLDIRMADMDGIQCLRLIKDRAPEIQVIMISGFASVKMARKSLDIGAFDYISKPLSFSHLKEVIQQLKISKFLEYM